jgi:hypothetical protein
VTHGMAPTIRRVQAPNVSDDADFGIPLTHDTNCATGAPLHILWLPAIPHQRRGTAP